MRTISATSLCYVLKEEIENLEFVQDVNVDFSEWLQSNDTKYLFIFDDSCREICNSKVSVDIAIVGRHRGLITIYIKHILFLRSKLGRDFEL